MTKEFEGLKFELRDRIAYITLNRPEAMNAILPSMGEGLEYYGKMVNDDPEIYAMIITGAGEKAFCAGGDLKITIPQATAAASGAAPKPSRDITKRFFSDVYKPIIAAVNGFAVAGGCEIVLGTDIRVACETASFGVAEVRWSLVAAGGGCTRLIRQLPWARAMEILLMADRISAQEALNIGLINRVVPREELMPTAEAIAKRICQNGPYAVRKAKEIAVRSYTMAWDEAFALESIIAQDVFASEDAKEGPKAFAEKRTPNFKNR